MRALLLLLIASTAAAEPWQVSDQTKGVETEIHAADVPLDLILTGLDDGPLIVRSHPERVTGDVVAPSPHGAVVAAFAAAGVQVPRHFVVDRSPAATIDVQFIDAPPEDLFRLIADTSCCPRGSCCRPARRPPTRWSSSTARTRPRSWLPPRSPRSPAPSRSPAATRS